MSRPEEKRGAPVRFVLGVDPGNDRAGVALWGPTGEHGGYRVLGSMTICPWDLELLPEEPPWYVVTGEVEAIRTYVACEVPQNGTHQSRGGVHWAGGMIVGRLLPRMGLKRKDVWKAKPATWRRKILGRRRTPDDWKAWAVACCRAMGLSVKSDDEAEAVLIGLARVLKEGWGPDPALLSALVEKGLRK